MSPAWGTARTAQAAVAGAAAVLLLGVVTGRADVAALAVAVLVAGTGDLWSRPRGALVVHPEPAEPGPDTAGALTSRLRIDAPAGTAAVLVSVVRPGRPDRRALIAWPPADEPIVRRRSVRTGNVEAVTAWVQGFGPGLGCVADPTGRATRRVLVLPGAARPGEELPMPTALRGLSGPHGSRRPGEGGDLRDVHPFQAGDRLRRIDWRVTARRSPRLEELYVRREHALAEAVVVLVVDSRDDVGPDPRAWSGPNAPRSDQATSLDIARTAAATLARGYLRAGDRVGLDDLGARRRPLPPGAGARQLDRIRHGLALSAPVGDPSRRVRAPRVPAGALIVLFSTFLDDEAVQVPAAWRAAGHRVLAVDVLPRLHLGELNRTQELAVRFVRIAREDRLAELADRGVGVVRWVDDPELALRLLARADRRRAGAGGPRR